MTIRPARANDASAVAALLGELGYRAALEDVARRIEMLGSSDAVLVADGGLVAVHRVPRLAEGDAFARITALVVAPTLRRNGLGRALLTAAEELARQWGCDLLEVSSARRPERDAAHAFYRAAGFVDTAPNSTRYWKTLGTGGRPGASEAGAVSAADHWRSPTGYEVSTDPRRLDIDRIHRFLANSYWSPGIPRGVVERAISNSLPFGLYAPSGGQAGFARVVTDRATYAYLADVYVEEADRGRGLGKFLIRCVLGHPELRSLRRLALATADAHGLYERHGFRASANPEMHMFIERSPRELWPPTTDGVGGR